MGVSGLLVGTYFTDAMTGEQVIQSEMTEAKFTGDGSPQSMTIYTSTNLYPGGRWTWNPTNDSGGAYLTHIFGASEYKRIAALGSRLVGGRQLRVVDTNNDGWVNGNVYGYWAHPNVFTIASYGPPFHFVGGDDVTILGDTVNMDTIELSHVLDYYGLPCIGGHLSGTDGRQASRGAGLTRLGLKKTMELLNTLQPSDITVRKGHEIASVEITGIAVNGNWYSLQRPITTEFDITQPAVTRDLNSPEWKRLIVWTAHQILQTPADDPVEMTYEVNGIPISSAEVMQQAKILQSDKQDMANKMRALVMTSGPDRSARQRTR
jgi:hypothetical protein